MAKLYKIKLGDSYVDPECSLARIADLVVFEPAEGWTDSGILDPNGYPLMSRSVRHPLGFITPKDNVNGS